MYFLNIALLFGGGDTLIKSESGVSGITELITESFARKESHYADDSIG